MTPEREDLTRAIREHDWTRPENVRAVANALFAICDEDIPHDQMLRDMALASGVAVAVPYDFARELEERDDQGTGKAK